MVDFIHFLASNMVFHMMIGVCLLLKLKSKWHARYLVISTFLFCILIAITSNKFVELSAGAYDVLFVSINALVTITSLANIVFFFKSYET